MEVLPIAVGLLRLRVEIAAALSLREAVAADAAAIAGRGNQTLPTQTGGRATAPQVTPATGAGARPPHRPHRHRGAPNCGLKREQSQRARAGHYTYPLLWWRLHLGPYRRPLLEQRSQALARVRAADGRHDSTVPQLLRHRSRRAACSHHQLPHDAHPSRQCQRMRHSRWGRRKQHCRRQQRSHQCHDVQPGLARLSRRSHGVAARVPLQSTQHARIRRARCSRVHRARTGASKTRPQDAPRRPRPSHSCRQYAGGQRCHSASRRAPPLHRRRRRHSLNGRRHAHPPQATWRC